VTIPAGRTGTGEGGRTGEGGFPGGAGQGGGQFPGGGEGRQFHSPIIRPFAQRRRRA